jgi:acyl-CoA synthetase (AMP-forming)/AMP-acid ligase II
VIDEAIASGHRYLIVAPFTLNAMYVSAMACLHAGATVVFEGRVAPAEALRLHAITHAKILPLQLRDILDRLPSDFAKLDGLMVTTIGGKLSGPLRGQTLARLAGRVRDQYSSNETGPISATEIDDATAIGTVAPDNRVEIVDDEDRILPFGQPGHIRAKTPYMADGYLDDPATTARMFRGGWFYPGDLGILHGPDRLEILGRDDDILNVGGLKSRPEDIEEMIRGRVALGDIGVCALPNAQGMEEIWIAVVYDAPNDADIRNRLKPAFAGFPYGHAHLVKLAAIPRTATGKIRRAELRDAVLATAEAQRRTLGR